MSQQTTDESSLIGQTIRRIRLINKAEVAREAWEGYPNTTMCTVIELENGTVMYASKDREGNGPGCLFGAGPDGETFYVMP